MIKFTYRDFYEHLVAFALITFHSDHHHPEHPVWGVFLTELKETSRL